MKKRKLMGKKSRFKEEIEESEEKGGRNSRGSEKR